MSDPSAAIDAHIEFIAMLSRAQKAEDEVARLKRALDEIRWGYNVNHSSKWARDHAAAAHDFGNKQ